MRGDGLRGPAAREPRKQLIAYLAPNQARAAYARSQAEGKTHQEVIGEAVNAVLASRGIDPFMPAGHQRLVRRNRGRAALRDGAATLPSRRGSVSFSGWFAALVVDRLNAHLGTLGLSVHSAIEAGLVMVTGVEPDRRAPGTPGAHDAGPDAPPIPDDVPDGAGEASPLA